MIVSGFDGTMEETFLGGRAALERGYNLFLMCGPGQMDTCRFYAGIPFRPDYEKPIGAGITRLLRRKEVDPRKPALMGLSLGGYFVVRAAAHDKRIHALIADSPIIDMHAYTSSIAGVGPALLPEKYGMTHTELENPQSIKEAAFRKIVAGMPPPNRANALAIMDRYGQKSLRNAFIYMKEFRVDKQDLANMTCPVLALAGAGEAGEAERQFRAFLRGVSGPATRYLFTQEEGADAHCQVNNLDYLCAVIYDWLDELFG